MTTTALDAAQGRATDAAENKAVAPAPLEVARWLAIGDPQAPLRRFFSVLDENRMLDDSGWLRPDVGLVSMGDHFDYKPGDPGEAGVATVAREGHALLAWLQAHDRRQVRILFGNHDAARVMEFYRIEDFARARRLAIEIQTTTDAEHKATLAKTFRAEFPDIPTSDIAARDYSSFTPRQRELVTSMLVDGRFDLGLAARVNGHEALLTHAGVTMAQLTALGHQGAAHPATIARALNSFLTSRVLLMALPSHPLSLEPLHSAGISGMEGGGLLYHRPSNPDDRETGDDPDWAFSSERPRRFAPTSLPRGLLQVCGHSNHKSTLPRVKAWATTDAQRVTSSGNIRTLVVSDERVRYEFGVHLPRQGDAALVMIDPELTATHDVELLPIDAVLFS